ncbi:adenosine deaminase [Fodinibius sp. Rm-B-1B1-1]|uniref:adenosine deaminase n=1 Tax=Fodinibius alkaliphilus TaxID=3140241 RepID=UPI00315A0EB4
MDFSALPKVELHLHLDCSLSFDVVQQLNSKISREEYRSRFVAPDKCRDLADYIRRSENAVSLMQDEESLRLVVGDLFNQLEADNIIYVEIRFAPLLHIQEDLTAEQVVNTVNEAVEEQVETTGIEGGIILCTLRHYSEEQSMRTVQLVEEFADSSRVVGFDIAADEAGFPIDEHVSAFEYANAKGLNCTAHAGEACGAESVWETLEQFKPSRIGHGVRSVEDPELMEYLNEHDIHLEVCPTSNVQTNVFETIEDHSINTLSNNGISLSVNTDTRTISDVTLDSEYQLLEQVFDWDKERFLDANLEAIDHAFTNEPTKEKLRRTICEAYLNN